MENIILLIWFSSIKCECILQSMVSHKDTRGLPNTRDT